MLRFFFRLGIFGLFLLSALDSSFLVLPFGNDLLLIALVSRGRSSLMWVPYVLVSAIGSIVGVFLVDVVMRKTGEKGLEHFLSPQKIEKLKKKIENSLKLCDMVYSRIDDLKFTIKHNIDAGLSSGSANTFLNYELEILQMFVGVQNTKEAKSSC